MGPKDESTGKLALPLVCCEVTWVGRCPLPLPPAIARRASLGVMRGRDRTFQLAWLGHWTPRVFLSLHSLREDTAMSEHTSMTLPGHFWFLLFYIGVGDS